MTERYALYRHFALDGKLLYVGVTNEPRRRAHGHRRRSPWWPLVSDITLAWYDSKRDALDAEGLAIRLERPAWNRTHLSGTAGPWLAKHWQAESHEQLAALERVIAASTNPGYAPFAKAEYRAAVAEAAAVGVPLQILARMSKLSRVLPTSSL